MSRKRVFLTCPPMLAAADQFIPIFERKGVDLVCAKMVQTLSEEELIEHLPAYDGWIAGDDPATFRVLEAGRKGRLAALVKWGIGVDSIDRNAVEGFGLKFANTPGMFGAEVADIAVGYLICLMRSVHIIHEDVKAGGWTKIRGSSLADKKVALFGFGDIGRNISKRLSVMGMRIFAVDPLVTHCSIENVVIAKAEEALRDADVIILACPLTNSNWHMLNRQTLLLARKGVRVVNVARGPLIDELSLIELLRDGHVASAALDVFEVEPLSISNPLREFRSCLFGSHNASNTQEAVVRASEQAMNEMFKFLGVQ